MADNKTDLARAGTMEVTSKEGQVFLEKNLTEWKKPYLMDQFQEEEEPSKPSKPKMAKHSTMVATAKEADSILGAAGRPDDDALTRGQQKKLEEITAEKDGPPSSKKARMSKANTMTATAKEGKALLDGKKLGDTRQVTKHKQTSKQRLKKGTTMSKAVDEAKVIYGKDLDMSDGRSLRKRPAKPPMKRDGTMQNTAKEGKAFLNRKKGKKENK